jgi:hypothetical protein
VEGEGLLRWLKQLGLGAMGVRAYLLDLLAAAAAAAAAGP